MINNKINFGEINNYILLGAGLLLVDIALYLKNKNKTVFVVTSQRQIDEIIFFNDEQIEFKTILAYKNISYSISNNVNNDENVVDKITPNTMGISFGAAWIFKKTFIDKFDGKLLNCHGSYLPQDKGGGGLSWRIMRGDRRGISLIHQINEGIDTGDIIMSDAYIFPSSCRCPLDYEHYRIQKYTSFLMTFFELVDSKKEFHAKPQQEYFSSYWPRLSTVFHGYIDWNWDIIDIENFICAFDAPYKGASTFINGERVYLKKCCLNYNDGVFHPFQDGIIYKIFSDIIFVAKRNGSLLIECVLDEQDNDIKQNLQLGDRFYTPMEFLQSAKESRILYTPAGIKTINPHNKDK